MDESTIIDQILAGNRQTLKFFYNNYIPKLSNHIRQKIDNPEDAEEILSDSLMAFLEALRDFTGKSSLNTFLYSIANHKIIDYYRRKKIKHLVFSRMPGLETLVSPLLSPEDQLESQILANKIRRTFRSILPHYRQILLFKYNDDLTIADIAGKLTVTIKSAESILFRARRAFVKAFIAT